MTQAFFGAVKEARQAALDSIDEALVAGFESNVASYKEALTSVVDKAIGGTLDAVEEHYNELVTASAVDGEGEDVGVDTTIVSGLSALYFEEISN